MKSFAKTMLAVGVLASLNACSRIETGQVGIIRGFDKQIQMSEALPGQTQNTIFQDVIEAQTKDITVDVQNIRPQAAENTTLDDMDLTVIYSVAPGMAAELYANKSSSFHEIDTKTGDYLLMYNYVYNLARNASYKAVREYKSLELNDNRVAIEGKILNIINAELNEDKDLSGAVTVSNVNVRQMLPAKSIVDSANEFIRSQNELKKKEVEVETAKKEAERVRALSQNKDAIEYMNAVSMQMIAQGVRDGKVQSIVVPADFKGIVNVGK